MASTLLLSVLLTSKQPENNFQSTLCQAECQPSSKCATPFKGFCPGWGEVCCQPSPTRASSANRCSNYAEKGYSCVPKTSCRVGGRDLTSRSEGGAWCPGWEEVCCRGQWQLPSCSQYSELGYSCVPKSQCDQGVIVTDGSGILQVCGCTRILDCMIGQGAGGNKCAGKKQLSRWKNHFIMTKKDKG